MLEYKDPS